MEYKIEQMCTMDQLVYMVQIKLLSGTWNIPYSITISIILATSAYLYTQYDSDTYFSSVDRPCMLPPTDASPYM